MHSKFHMADEKTSQFTVGKDTFYEINLFIGKVIQLENHFCP